MNDILGFVFMCALVILFALLIQKNCSHNEKQAECEMIYCERLKQHDLKCCILIMFICIVFICTLAFGNYKPILEYISFAGTITSIILSVLAIMMTLLAEAGSNDAKVKMDNHLDLVQKLSDKTDGQISRIERLIKELSDKEADNKKLIEKQDEMIKRQSKLMSQVDSLSNDINQMSFGNKGRADWQSDNTLGELLKRRIEKQ